MAIELLDGDDLVIAAIAGEIPSKLLGARVPIGETMAETALRTLTTQRLEETLNRNRFEHHGEITTLRALITELRPAALDELGLPAAITALADRSGEMGLEVDVDVAAILAEDVVIDPEFQIAIYRIVQEALSNARKDGQATRAVVSVEVDESAVTVTVRDDGAGFDVSAPAGGFGLVGMRERAELLGGTVALVSGNGAGTTVTVPREEAPPSAAAAALSTASGNAYRSIAHDAAGVCGCSVMQTGTSVSVHCEALLIFGERRGSVFSLCADSTTTGAQMSDSPDPHQPEAGHTPTPHRVPTEAEVLEALRQQGVTDLESLAAKIVAVAQEEEESDEPATESTFIWDGDSYVYHHVSVPTTAGMDHW